MLRDWIVLRITVPKIAVGDFGDEYYLVRPIPDPVEVTVKPTELNVDLSTSQ
jgi:hypothetical protein